MLNDLIIFGLGNHTKNKIIPVLKEMSIPIVGIITATKIDCYKGIKVYKSIDNVKNKKNISHCIISTTPSQQVNYIKQLSSMGVSIFIEKPAFINKKDLTSVQSHFSNNLVLTEGMMYRFGSGFNYFTKNILNIKDIKQVFNISFILPYDPIFFLNSFRGKLDIKNSIVYDIGSYIFDILWVTKIFNFTLNILSLEQFPNKVIKRLKCNLTDKEGGFLKNINIDIGYDNFYQNEIKFNSKTYELIIDPFFWGRSGKININQTVFNKNTNTKIDTKNGLKEMINTWIYDKDDINILDLQNYKRYEFIISKLAELEKEIKKYAK